MRDAVRCAAVVLTLCLMEVLAPNSASAQPKPVTVLADASLSDALQEVAGSYRRSSGAIIILSFGQSASLAKQIENGASAQIFVSAAKTWVERLARADRIEKSPLASGLGNRLVLIGPSDSQVEMLISPMTPMSAFLGSGKLAMGDPDLAAAGVFAKEALIKLGDWQRFELRLALAPSAEAALKLVETGRAGLGLVFYTTALSSKKVKITGYFGGGVFTSFSYTFAIVKGEDSADTRAFFNFLTGPAAREIYAKYGFLIG
jgi:molybdate transport system substrate-binding protein